MYYSIFDIKFLILILFFKFYLCLDHKFNHDVQKEIHFCLRVYDYFVYYIETVNFFIFDEVDALIIFLKTINY